MSSSWRLPQAPGQSWVGARVHGCSVNHPLQAYTELSPCCVPASRPRMEDVSQGPHHLSGVPQSSRIHQIGSKGLLSLSCDFSFYMPTKVFRKQ